MSGRKFNLADAHWAHLLLLAALVPSYYVSQAWPADRRLLLWLVLNFAVLAVAEQVSSYQQKWRTTGQQLPRDGAILAINAVFDAAATAVLALLTIAAIMHLGGLKSTLTLPMQCLLGALAAEFFSYWLHRLSHADNWLWRVHMLHHRPDRLNVANALTAHPINALLDKLARTLPLIGMGLSADAIVAITMFTLTQSLVTHANVRGSIGGLSYLITSAALHRMHHSDQEQHAGNFGTTLMLWDLLFGTYRKPQQNIEVGVYEASRYPSEFAIFALLRWPFSKKTSQTVIQKR